MLIQLNCVPYPHYKVSGQAGYLCIQLQPDSVKLIKISANVSVWAWLCPSSSVQALLAGSGNLAQGAHDWAFKHSRPTFWIIDSLVCLRILWYFSKAVSNIAISHNNVCVSMKSVHASSALACSLYHPRSIPEVMQSLLKSVENFLLTSVNLDFHWLQWALDQSQRFSCLIWGLFTWNNH